MKTLITLILLVLVGALLYFYLGGGYADIGGQPKREMSEYFQERMTTLGVNEGYGFPIEGFDAGLLMGAFPGLVEGDFDGVEAFEGHYEIVNGELAFERDFVEPVSSAERTVSVEGYGTLLGNLSRRLEIEPTSTANVDRIISVIDEVE